MDGGTAGMRPLDLRHATREGTRWVKRMRAESEAEKQESWRVAGPELRAAIRRVIEQEGK